MSSTSNYTIGTTPCLPGRNVKFTNIHVCKDGEVGGNLEVNTINGLPYPQGGGFTPTPIPNKVLRTDGLSVISWGDVHPYNLIGGSTNDVLKTIAPGVVAWDTIKPLDITPGLANQVMTVNTLGTNAQWSDSVNLPDALTVNGITNIVGDLRFNNLPGSVGQYIKKTGVSTQAFSTLIPSDITAGGDYNVLTSFSGVAQWYPQPQIKRIIYGTYFTSQDINSAAGPTALSFEVSPFTNVATSTTTPITGITQPSATQFVIGNTTNYVIMVTGYIDLTSTGLGNSIVTLSLEIDGTEQQSSAIVCNGNYSFSGSFRPISLSTGQTIRILARRVVGTGTLITNATGSVIPNFASTISFVNL